MHYEVVMKKFVYITAVLLLALSMSIVATSQDLLSSAKSARNVTVDSAKFAVIDAVSEGRGVFLKWTLEYERNNVGFDVYRLTGKDFVKVTPNTVLASRGSFSNEIIYGGEYQYFDRDGSLGNTYIIEALSSTGARTRSFVVTAGYTNDLSAVAGRSIEAVERSNSAAPELLEQTAPRLPKELWNEVTKSRAYPDSATQRMLTGQAGVKIGVKADGFYRVTAAELQAAGLDTSADPTNWKLYTSGVEQAINVGPGGGFIEFMAKVNETVEADTSFYYLVNTPGTGKRIAARSTRPSFSTVVSQNYQATYSKKERVNYIYDILNGDAENFWGNLISSTATTFNFNVTGIDTTAASAVVEINMQGFSIGAHSTTFSINGNVLPVVTGAGPVPMSISVTIPVSYLVEGQNALQMSTAVAGDYSLFDKITVKYTRKFAADQNQIRFYTSNYRAAVLIGFSSANVRVFDTTLDGEPVEFTNLPTTQNGATFDVRLPATRGRMMYAVENGSARQAASVRANVPSELSTNAQSAKLVIITHGDFTQQAQVWRQYRVTPEFPVIIADVEDIFDEFGFGQPSADAIRAFIAHAKTNWQIPPEYVLILGDASFDPKNYTGFGYTNLVPAKMISTVYEETGSDEALADLNWDGLAELAIGRVPAKTPQDVSNALAKVMAFETPAMQDMNRGAVFAYDLPNGYDFQGMSILLRNQLPSTMPAVMVGRGDVNSGATLMTQLNLGPYIVNYSGHGSTGLWASTAFFSNNNVPLLTNSTRMSIYTMLTCLNGYYVNPYSDSLGERLLKATNGGSVMSWASAGKTTPDIQAMMGLRFYEQIALGNITRVGDLVKDAKTVIPGGSDVRFSWALLGDPMLKVR